MTVLRENLAQNTSLASWLTLSNSCECYTNNLRLSDMLLSNEISLMQQQQPLLLCRKILRKIKAKTAIKIHIRP